MGSIPIVDIMGLDSVPEVNQEQRGKVDSLTCENMRLAAHNGVSVSEIVENIDIDITGGGVRYHIHGECSHTDIEEPISKDVLSNGASPNQKKENKDWNGKFKKSFRGSVKGEPEVALYPCGDIRFNVNAVKQWNLNAMPGAEIYYNIRTCEIWIFFKQTLKDKYYAVDHSKTQDYSARIQSNNGILRKLRINKPEKRINLDFEWISDNNVLYVDMLTAA